MLYIKLLLTSTYLLSNQFLNTLRTLSLLPLFFTFKGKTSYCTIEVIVFVSGSLIVQKNIWWMLVVFLVSTNTLYLLDFFFLIMVFIMLLDLQKGVLRKYKSKSVYLILRYWCMLLLYSRKNLIGSQVGICNIPSILGVSNEK